MRWAPITSVTRNDAYQILTLFGQTFTFANILKSPPCLSASSQRQDAFTCPPDFINFTHYISHYISVRVNKLM